MKFLYVPWRNKYVKGTRKENEEKENCAFCNKFKDTDDKKNFILGRYKYNAAILNLHPYNAGHLMIIPLNHVKNLNELTKEERSELMELVSKSTEIVTSKLGADGVNVGLNLGKSSGAGIPGHLHMHVLPRWEGDTNFLPLLADTKTISFDLNKIYDQLKVEFENIKI